MKKKVVFISSAIVLVILGAGFFYLRPQKIELAKRYDFFTVQRQDLVEEVDATGQVEAEKKKDLYTDFEAMVEKVHVKAGDTVKKGDIIISLKSSVLKEQLQEAESLLEQARLGSKQAASQLATEVALNRVSETNALQLENYYHQWAVSREQEEQAKQRIKALNAKNDGMYGVENNELLICAPFSGQVGWINVRQGEKVTPQTLMATVIQPDALSVEVWIDQNDIALITSGQKAKVTGKDERQSENPGVVTEISKIGQAEGEIVSFPVRIQMNSDTRGLRPGMTVDVTIMAKEYPNIVGVPAGGVTQKDGRDWVNIRRNDQIVAVAVELGYKQGKFWEVKSGVKAGDEVAIPKLPQAAKRSITPGVGGRGVVSPMGRR